MASLVVLEDCPSRLKWLRSALPKSIQFRYTLDSDTSEQVVILGEGKLQYLMDQKPCPDSTFVLVCSPDPDEMDRAMTYLCDNKFNYAIVPYSPLHLVSISQIVLSNI